MHESNWMHLGLHLLYLIFSNFQMIDSISIFEAKIKVFSYHLLSNQMCQGKIRMEHQLQRVSYLVRIGLYIALQLEKNATLPCNEEICIHWSVSTQSFH